MTVYFAQSAQTGLVKIGRSLNIPERLMFLSSRTKQTFHLLGWMNGSYFEERTLHLRFADFCHHREWFEPDIALMTYIKRKAFPPPAPPPENGKTTLHVWVDARLFEKLQNRAIANEKSIAQEVRAILSAAVGVRPSVGRYCRREKGT